MKEKNIARKLKKLDDNVTKVMAENFEMSQRIKALEEYNKKMEDTWQKLLRKD